MSGKFRIIPVIDILNGIAVHAVKGERNKYEPIKSVLIPEDTPEEMLCYELIKAFRFKFGFEELYIADLDSIIREKPNITKLRRIREITDQKIMIDIGIRDVNDIGPLQSLGIDKIIIATETISKPEIVGEICDILGAEQIIISLDMKNGKLLSASPALRNLALTDVIKLFGDYGINEFILLDLIRIGTGSGCYCESYGEIRRSYPEATLIVGGGARDIEDLRLLRSKGMDGVLIATALHKGIITPEDIKKFYSESE